MVVFYRAIKLRAIYIWGDLEMPLTRRGQGRAAKLRSMSKNAKSPRQPATAKPEQVIEELRPGQSIELLKELHILTREGKLNQDTRRKLKQVYHLYQFIEPLLNEVSASSPAPALADHGAGKSYLGFILYDLFFNVAHRGEKTTGHIYGIETRAELVEKSRVLAARLGFERMSFLNLSVQEATRSPDLPAGIDIVTALHACDTATDDAIAFGLAKNARHMVLVPCCQAEVAGVLKKGKALNLAKNPLAELWRHPLHTREFGSQITNVLRCLQLEASGYQVTVTELVGWEHSMKNELILASRPAAPHPAKTRAAQIRLQQVLDELGLGELTSRFAVPAISEA
ncbi:Methyltransferase domain protein [compost metagenome]